MADHARMISLSMEAGPNVAMILVRMAPSGVMVLLRQVRL